MLTFKPSKEIVTEETSEGELLRYIRGLGLISSECVKAGTWYHYASDENGSITHIVADDENALEEDGILNEYSYDAFGTIIQKKETLANRFLYNGEQYDDVTGQY